jgi:molybdopterin/thiamine biosynthesis adenylyltransferase
MSADLISRNPDLQQLQADGYEMEIRQGAGLHLLIHIPYVNASRQVLRGTLVSPLILKENGLTNGAANHQAWFIGEHPCNAEGVELAGIKHSTGIQDFGDGIVVQHGFSTKPSSGSYPDYHAKMTRHIDIISAPAQHLDKTVRVRTHKPIALSGESVFHYADMASTRAGIGAMAAKLAPLRIAIVGLGGTGAYILDLVAKTHVREIHLFDGDGFYSHNAFRAPGAVSFEELSTPVAKVDCYQRHYSKMRRGITPHAMFITDETVQALTDFDFVFVCVDKAAVRKLIADVLLERRIPFIDVGMDVRLNKEATALFGQVRTTLFTPEKGDHYARRVPTGDGDADDVYRSNIQIVELNALNATFAVIKWKKYFGYFEDAMHEHDSVYAINGHLLTKDERL